MTSPKFAADRVVDLYLLEPHPVFEQWAPRSVRWTERAQASDARRMSRSQTKKHPRRVAEVGAVYTFPIPGGRFGACQVLSSGPTPGSVELAALDFVEATPPSADRLAELRVLRRTWGNWRDEPARCVVDASVPWWAERLGEIAPVERFEDEPRSFGSWHAAYGAYDRERWERGARRIWKHDSALVQVDLGSGGADVRRDVSRIRIGPRGHVRAPSTGVRFDALDALPCLNEIEYEGADGALIEYVVDRKISRLTWSGYAQSVIDLRESSVNELSLDVRAPVTVHAPQHLGSWTVRGDPALLTARGASTAFPFRLTLSAPRIARPPQGLEDVQSVQYDQIEETHTEGLSAFTRLAELGLRGAPGKLADASGLIGLAELRALTIYDLYALDAESWASTPPRLEHVTMHGVRKADALLLKAKLGGVSDVRITGARSDDWIKANLDNPLREWGEDHPALGRAAQSAWKKARANVTKLGVHASRADAERALRDFVTLLNRLHAKHTLDTLRREDAAEAFGALARDLGVREDQAAEWFDAWRDF